MEYILNLAIITLLIIAIIYAMILNYRLNSFKEGKKEISKTIYAFNQVVQNAETTLSQLQKSTQNIAEQLKIEIQKASLLRDDLVLILDKNAQKNSEKNFTSHHVPYLQNKASFAQNPSKKPSSNVDIYQSDAEKELYQALQRLKGAS
ncbi:MAG: hypothetical protein E7013_05030 [Alphaproteobacteria bacterium]|nr:hypothetical protein [Alphaproteobacteria bacterium]